MMPETDTRETEQVERADPLRLGLLVAALASLACVVTLANSSGDYVADLPLDVSWRPSRTLFRLPQLWDSSGGLGRVAGPEGSPLAAAVFALARGAGAPVWIAQRAWHALLLTVAGTGCVAVVRYVAPRVGPWHVISALAYVLSPLGLGLLVPSPGYVPYAVAPWLLAAALYGVGCDRPWRWAAVSALGIFVAASADPAGTAYAIGFVLLALVYVVHVERRSTWLNATLWVLKAGVLTVAATAWLVMRFVLAHDPTPRAQTVDTPAVIATTTSWSESFRGLGNWRTYLPLGSSFPGTGTHLDAYLENPVVILTTFAIPVIALGALFRRSRSLSFFAVLSAVSLVLLVGMHPIDDPSPGGELTGWLHDKFPSTEVFRDTTKAGVGHALGIAVLFGAAVDSIRRRVSSAGIPSSVVTGAAIGLLAIGSLPVWIGNLYSPENKTAAVPDYWEEAAEWLDAQPGDGRVIALPGTSTPVYRWGRPGDDLFAALLERPYVQASTLGTSTSVVDSLSFSLGTRLRSLALADQSLAPAMRRIGIQYVVLRNDLAWFDAGVPRPANLAAVRDDPNLRLIRTFGAEGENTTGPDDLSPIGLSRRASPAGQLAQEYESALAPVEIYELVDDASRARVTAAEADVIVAGDGDAWFGLTSLGLVDGDRPVRFLADLDDHEVTASLLAGGRAVITDTNLRRRTTETATSYIRSSALPALAEGTGIGSLFPDPASQTVSWTADAASIEAVRPSDAEPWFRAEQAFDGDQRTAWRFQPRTDGRGQGVIVHLREREVIGRIAIVVAQAPEAKIRRGHVELDDGTRLPFTVADGLAEVDGRGRLSRTVSIIIDEISPSGPERLGFTEITIDGLDLEPARQLPRSLFQRAEADPDLADALASSRLSFSFEREHEFGELATETGLRRRFLTDGTRSFVLRGRLWLSLDVLASASRSACTEWLEIDGEGVPLRLISELDEDLGTSEFQSCEPIEVGGGWHLLEDVAGARIDRLELDEEELQEPSDEVRELGLTVDSRGPSHLALAVDAAAGGSTVLTGIAFDVGWAATVDGRAHDTVQLDGQVAVRLSDAGAHQVELTFEPQRWYDLAVLVSMITVAFCVAVALSRPRRASELEPEHAT